MNRVVLAMLAAAAILASPALAAPEAKPAILSLVVTEPRGFGYFVGDVFRREIDVVVAEPYRFDTASQPAPGRLNYWLDLRSVHLDETGLSGRRRYHLILDYQTFYVPLSAANLTVPGMTLRFSSDSGGKAEVQVPSFAFVMAPLREVQPEQPEEGPAGYLKPDAVPRETSTLRSRIAAGVGALLTLLALALLAYHRAWWPFRARPERPFTRAARAIKGRLSAGDIAAYRADLLDLHRAFDSAAGHRLLAEDVPGFLIAHREFQPLKDDIARFFANSRRAFFGNDISGAAKIMPAEAVAALGSRLGEAERRTA